MNSWMVLVPVLLPILMGMLIPCLKILEREKIRNIYVTGALGLELIVVWLWMGREGSSCLAFFLLENLPIYFHIDRLSVFFSGLISVIWICSGIFALEYMKHEGEERRYYTFYLIAEGLCQIRDL